MRASWNVRRTRPKSGLRDWDDEPVDNHGSRAEESARVDQSCTHRGKVPNFMIVPMIQVRHQLRLRNIGEVTVRYLNTLEQGLLSMSA